MLVNIHLGPKIDKISDQNERFDTLISPSGTIATLLNIEKSLGENNIIGIDESFSGEIATKNKVREIIENDINHNEITTIFFTLLLYNSERTIDYINELKNNFAKKINIIVGGQLVPLAKEAYLNNKNIDVTCVGDAEVIMPKLLEDLNKNELKNEYEEWLINGDNKKFAGVSFDNYWQIKERMITQKKRSRVFSINYARTRWARLFLGYFK